MKCLYVHAHCVVYNALYTRCFTTLIDEKLRAQSQAHNSECVYNVLLPTLLILALLTHPSHACVGR